MLLLLLLRLLLWPGSIYEESLVEQNQPGGVKGPWARSCAEAKFLAIAQESSVKCEIA